ncbi:MAG: arginine decarboxylase, pyruvoyl-dependent [Acidobacteriota bacterium]
MRAVFIPTKLFLTKGVGVHKERLTSFEMALRDAGVARFNIITVSSIVPPQAKVITRTAGLKLLYPGQIVPCVIAQSSTNEPHRLVAAAIGAALPKDPSQHGYLSEHHSHGETEEKAGKYAENLAAHMLATTLGVSQDSDTIYDPNKEIWKISDQIVRTTNVAQSAVGHKDGLWTTVMASAVLLA